VSATRISCHLNAPRERVYTALTTAEDVARWKFPSDMTCEVHEFDGREGGRIRVSLTYVDSGREGKTEGRTDTYHGRFASLVPNELVVEVDEFETSDPALAGEMTSTIRLSDAADGGTELVAVHEGLPASVSEADNEAGWREALSRLAQLVEPNGSMG
jgi:uncharacterized protein YndB with AHSA1/START domain